MSSIAPISFPLSDDYVVLRPLSLRSQVYLCRERASNRMLTIKLFAPSHHGLFAAEIAALAQLEGSALSPRLYFSLFRENWGVLGSEYIPGECLATGITSWQPAEREAIASALFSAVDQLHQEHGVAHLDISPKNILVTRGEQNPLKITFVDWEAAADLRKPKLSDLDSRGTPGFSENPDAESLVEKDLASAAACVQYLGVVPGSVRSTAEKPARNKRFLWI